MFQTTPKRLLWTFIILSAVIFNSGCTNYDTVPASFKRPNTTVATSENYKFLPPDIISLKCAKVTEIDGVSQTIRPDGKINLEGIGDVKVAGKTAHEISAIVKTKYSSLYNLPSDNAIAIVVSKNASRFIYITGEVRKKGAKLYTGHDSAVNMIYAATPEITAELKHIRVIRPSKDSGQAQIFEIDLKALIEDGDLSRDVLLEEGDIIYVPPTPLAALGNVIGELVRPIGLALQPVLTVSRLGE